MSTFLFYNIDLIIHNDNPNWIEKKNEITHYYRDKTRSNIKRKVLLWKPNFVNESNGEKHY